MTPLLPRRHVLLGLVAATLPAMARAGSPPADPLAGIRAQLTPALQARLLAVAHAIERHRWEELLGYADPEHRAGQQELFSAPGEGPARDPAAPAEQARFREWYLKELLGVAMVGDHVDKLDDIARIRYTAVEAQDDADLLRILFEVEVRGPRKLQGWFFIGRDSLRLSGAVG